MTLTDPARLSPRTVICPACGGPSVYANSNRWRPFCSERCQKFDLGAWASEQFKIAADADPVQGDEASQPRQGN